MNAAENKDVWRPTQFVRWEAALSTSMQTVRVLTDAGKAYLKPLMGGDRGPHPLACDLVGTRLAAWFGLPTPDVNVINIDEIDEIWLSDDRKAAPGPALAVRAFQDAVTWGGSAEELDDVDDLRSVIARLVVFDTWTLNWDRFAPPALSCKPRYDNVLLIGEGARKGRRRLVPIDFGECFSIAGTVSPRIATIDRVRDDRVYGLFPAFKTHLSTEAVTAAGRRLREIDTDAVRAFIAEIPDAWEVSDKAREALLDLVCLRASYLADEIVTIIASSWVPPDLFGGETEEKTP